jgi:hypothetical protein
MKDIIKCLLLSSTLLLFSIPTKAQFYFGSTTKYDIDEFVISAPTSLEGIDVSDTAELDTSKNYMILDKQITYLYKYPEGNASEEVQSGKLVAFTEYISKKEDIDRIKGLNLSGKSDFGFKIYKRNGEEVSIEEEEEDDFNDELESELEAGCIIQYHYVIKNYGSVYYGDIQFREKVPVNRARIYLQAEDKLTYRAKSYNGAVEILDSTISGAQVLGYEATKIPAFSLEKLAVPSLSDPKIYYNIKYNKHWTDKIIFDYKRAASYYYGVYFPVKLSDKKALTALYSKIGISEDDEVEDKIMKIDEYIRDNFERAYGKKYSELSKILAENKMGTDGAAKLYIALAQEADVKVELVFTTDYFKDVFDKKFPTWGYFDLVYLYFPETKEYLSPSNLKSSYGEIPSSCRGNYALHIFPYDFGDIQTPKGKVRRIPESDYSKNMETLNLSIAISPDSESQTVKFEQRLTGEMGQTFRGKLEDIDFDDEEELFNYRCKEIDENAWPNSDYEVSLDDDNVFKMTGSFLTDSLLVNEDDKLKIKLGALIGHELTLEDTAKRFSPVGVMPLKREKVIRLTVPEGYDVIGVDDFNQNFIAKVKGKETLNYLVKAEQKDNTVTITLNESYMKMIYSTDEYADFKQQSDLGNKIHGLSLTLDKKP